MRSKYLFSGFVTNVEVYDNPATVAYQKSSNGQGRLDYDRITDAKLKIFLEKSKQNEDYFSGLDEISPSRFNCFKSSGV